MNKTEWTGPLGTIASVLTEDVCSDAVRQNIVMVPHDGHLDCPFGGHDCGWWTADIDDLVMEVLAEHFDAAHFDQVAFKDLDVT